MTAKGPHALDIKSATIHTVRLVLHSADTSELLDALNQRMQEAAGFFEGEPVVIDCSAIHEPVDWSALLEALKKHQLHPIAMTGSQEQSADAAAHHLASVELSTSKVVVDIPKAPEPESEPVVAEPAPALITALPKVHKQPVRSGQRCFAPDGDLIIMGMVAQGAEIIAAGNIFVHGPLRGKAIAGAHGNTNAFILANEFDAELIAIAGVYQVIEEPAAHPHHKQTVLIQLEGDSITFDPLDE